MHFKQYYFGSKGPQTASTVPKKIFASAFKTKIWEDKHDTKKEVDLESRWRRKQQSYVPTDQRG